MASTTTKKEVLVLGGGLAGMYLIKALEKHHDLLAVTLVEPRDFAFIKYAALRAVALGGKWADGATLPISKALKYATHKQAMATFINSEAKTVSLDNGETLSYDYLVVSLGMRNFSPGEPPAVPENYSAQGTKQYWSGVRDEINKAKSVAILGTGTVAIELAGEVRMANANASVTILAGHYKLLSGVSPELPSRSIAHLVTQLKEVRVEIASGDDVVSPPLPSKEAMLTASAVLDNVTVQFKSGATRTFDVFIFALGGVMRAKSVVPSAWLDTKTGEIEIDEYFRVKGEPNVFAFGDAAKTGRAKTGSWATHDAEYVAHNLVAVAKNHNASSYSRMRPARAPFIVIPVGDQRGVLVLGPLVFYNLATSFFKGKDLILTKSWRNLASSPSPQ